MKIVAFLCKNSAHLALEAARVLRFPVPEGLQEVVLPCAGKTDALLILKAFEKGADGVFVAGCQRGACRYLTGNTRAEQMVEAVAQDLAGTGIERSRIRFETVTSNQPVELAEKIGVFAKTLEEMGKVRA
jgi:coenzyme F420-reducing hydrogenase delta subunit